MNPEILILPSPRRGSPATRPSEPTVSTRPRRILVADDDEGIRDLISVILVGDGFDVTAASDGQQAWEALSHERYDLLVTDNEMPGLTGIELVERIHEAGMGLAVIIVSGTLLTEKPGDNPVAHVTEVLPKPFTIPELLDAVRHALQASYESATAERGIFARLHAATQLIR